MSSCVGIMSAGKCEPDWPCGSWAARNGASAKNAPARTPVLRLIKNLRRRRRFYVGSLRVMHFLGRSMRTRSNGSASRAITGIILPSYPALLSRCEAVVHRAFPVPPEKSSGDRLRQLSAVAHAVARNPKGRLSKRSVEDSILPCISRRLPFVLNGRGVTHTMSNKPTKLAGQPQGLAGQPQGEDPRRAFETAISQLQQGTAHRSPSQIPIGLQRHLHADEDPAAEKRMLSDAARALARLWNVSPTLM